MEEKNWMQILSGQNQLAKVIATNQVTEKFGLVLSEEDAKLLVNEKSESLKEQKRIGRASFRRSFMNSAIRITFPREIMWRRSDIFRTFSFFTRMR